MPYWIVVCSLLDEIRFLFSFLYQKWRNLSLTRGEVLVPLRVVLYGFFFDASLFLHFTQYSPANRILKTRSNCCYRKRRHQGTNFLQVRSSGVSGQDPGVPDLILDCFIISSREDITRPGTVCNYTDISGLKSP